MQFDVYENENPSSRKRFPYLLDVQADLLQALATTVVVPLGPRAEAEERTLSRLMPVLRLDGQEVVAHTPQLAGIARRHVGRHVGNVAHARDDIVAALDLLFTGS